MILWSGRKQIELDKLIVLTTFDHSRVQSCKVHAPERNQAGHCNQVLLASRAKFSFQSNMRQAIQLIKLTTTSILGQYHFEIKSLSCCFAEKSVAPFLPDQCLDCSEIRQTYLSRSATLIVTADTYQELTNKTSVSSR